MVCTTTARFSSRDIHGASTLAFVILLYPTDIEIRTTTLSSAVFSLLLCLLCCRRADVQLLSFEAAGLQASTTIFLRRCPHHRYSFVNIQEARQNPIDVNSISSLACSAYFPTNLKSIVLPPVAPSILTEAYFHANALYADSTFAQINPSLAGFATSKQKRLVSQAAVPFIDRMPNILSRLDIRYP